MYTQRQWKVTSIEISIFRKIYITALWLLLMFLVNGKLVWRDKKLQEPWNYGTRAARAFCAFSQFLRIWNHHFQKTTCQTCPRHFHWKRHQNGLGYPIKHEKWGSKFKVAPKLCIFPYNAMETTGVRQRMIMMHLGVMDTVFHSGDECSLCHKIECWSTRSPSLRMN